MIARSRNRGAPPPAVPATAFTTLQPEVPDTSRVIAQLVPLEPGFYAFRLENATGWDRAGLGFAVPAVQVSALPAASAIDIADEDGGPGSWLGGAHRVLFVKAADGGTALVTAYLARDPDSAPLRLDIFRIGNGAAGAASAADPGQPVLTLNLSGADTGPWPRPVTIHVLAHIRGRGDIRFFDTPWAGRLGSGQWVEAFTLAPRPAYIAAALEYKGLMAGGGETDWLPCGAPCGTRGRGTPLLGFAIRQKGAASDMRYDCEYSGYFTSGATAGPARNGAPCRSSAENDPLEGLQVIISRRPARMPGIRA